jgi:hypothetical protein
MILFHTKPSLCVFAMSSDRRYFPPQPLPSPGAESFVRGGCTVEGAGVIGRRDGAVLFRFRVSDRHVGQQLEVGQHPPCGIRDKKKGASGANDI